MTREVVWTDRKEEAWLGVASVLEIVDACFQR